MASRKLLECVAVSRNMIAVSKRVVVHSEICATLAAKCNSIEPWLMSLSDQAADRLDPAVLDTLVSLYKQALDVILECLDEFCDGDVDNAPEASKYESITEKIHDCLSELSPKAMQLFSNKPTLSSQSSSSSSSELASKLLLSAVLPSLSPSADSIAAEEKEQSDLEALQNAEKASLEFLRMAQDDKFANPAHAAADPAAFKSQLRDLLIQLQSIDSFVRPTAAVVKKPSIGSQEAKAKMQMLMGSAEHGEEEDGLLMEEDMLELEENLARIAQLESELSTIDSRIAFLDNIVNEKDEAEAEEEAAVEEK